MAECPTYQERVAVVLDRWPETVQVFVDWRMGCVGCVMARFETVADVADVYGIAREDFLGALRAACRT